MLKYVNTYCTNGVMYVLCTYLCMYVFFMYVWVHSKVRGGGKKATAAVVIVFASCNNDRRCCSRAQFPFARSRWAWSSPSGNWVVCGRVFAFGFFFLW